MKNFICKFLIATLIGLQSTFGMAETAALLPNGMQTFLDANGHPLTSGTVDFFIPATSTRKNTWKESTEINLNTNPVVLDTGGRAVIYGFGDYRQVVKDRNGNTIWDKLTTSAGTGGSSPSLIGDGNVVGTILQWSGFVALPNYVFAFGQEITRLGFPEFFSTVTSAQATFCTSGSAVLSGLTDTTQLPIGGNVEASCLPTSSTIISKTPTSVTVAVNANASSNIIATFFPWGNGNGTTTFNVPDYRGRVLAGRDNMGGTAASRLTTSVNGFAVNASAIGAAGGGESQTLTTAQIPSHLHTQTAQNPTFTWTPVIVQSGTGNTVTGNIAATGLANPVTTASDATPGDTANTGGGTAHPNVQPTITTNYIVKVTPDTSSSIATGVASLGGMTGILACGTGLTCSANTVTVNSAAFIPTANSIANGQLAQMPANTIKCNNTGSIANALDCTVAQITALLLLTTQPGGRLTLQSGVSVQNADQSAKSTIFYTCHKSAYAPIPTGSTFAIFTIPSCEISVGLDTTHVTSGNGYDMFLFNNSGTLALCVGGTSWTTGSQTGNVVAHSTFHIQNTLGYWTNQDAITNCWGGALGTTNFGSLSANTALYVGSFLATANGQTSMVVRPTAASGGNNTKCGVWNAYNRAPFSCKSQDSTAEWDTTSAGGAVVCHAAGTGSGLNNRVNFIDGLAQDRWTANYWTSIVGATSAVFASTVELGLDGTSATGGGGAGQIVEQSGAANPSTNFGFSIHALYNPYPTIGVHFIQCLEGGANVHYFGNDFMMLWVDIFM